ncbi:hypothetical protein Ae406Ps2_6236 [Pseudonocardia sp. Ae406_Ps2]|nr:hypothetical protein Ae406Ps2_6236 [Pseudonocardia sp. Ae406_Ps2]OLM09820.1 hypothetical protein Ae706Ps2_6282 [Pseudonocardia sp. Ae706_Ps2]OLM09834.1 hypothetical protein Ae706Ps2_6296 [Pseudonocardia sp. Ae706_Ps2]
MGRESEVGVSGVIGRSGHIGHSGVLWGCELGFCSGVAVTDGVVVL